MASARLFGCRALAVDSGGYPSPGVLLVQSTFDKELRSGLQGLAWVLMGG